MLWRAFDKTVRRKPLAFAADAMGFQSTFWRKLLKGSVLGSNRKYIDLTMKEGQDRPIVTRHRPFFKTVESAE
jgi:hypothetical protein